MTFAERYGPWAFVAGASEGLGAAFAHEIARRGVNVLLAARRAELLEQVAAAVRDAHGVAALAVPLDLAAADLEARAWELSERYKIGLLVHNAATSPKGPLVELPIDAHLTAIDVNVRSLVVLTHVFGSAMTAQGRGGVVVMSSMAGFQGTAMVASYAATKAFGRVLAEGLWEELRARNVDVVASCAGATRTPGYERTTAKDVSRVMEPGAVAKASLDALGKGPVVVPGASNKMASVLMGALPRRWAVRMISRATRKLYE